MKPLLQPFPFPPGRRAQAWRYQPQYRRPLHFHAEPELNLVWRGRARFSVGDQTFLVERGGLLILPPGIEHALVEASHDLEFFAVGFQPELLDAYARSSGALTLGVACRELSEAVTERLARLCRGVGEAPDRFAVEAALAELWTHVALPEGQLGARAASLVRQRGAIGRDELAKTLASNRGDLSRCFHRHNGVTLREFKRRVRVLDFLCRIDNQTRNLTRAALSAGFGSYSQFHRDFCHVIGVSPRVFLFSGERQAVAARFEPFTSIATDHEH